MTTYRLGSEPKTTSGRVTLPLNHQARCLNAKITLVLGRVSEAYLLLIDGDPALVFGSLLRLSQKEMTVQRAFK